ncbi:MAG: tetratricopeptide repeat protein [Bryobacteraceae bacterium]
MREALASRDVLVLGREERLEAYRRHSMRHGALLTRASIIKIGDTLDAAKVIHGTYEVTAPKPSEQQEEEEARLRLRINAGILDLKRLHKGPEFGEAGALDDLAGMVTHLSWQSLQFLAPKTAPSEQEFRKAHPAVRVDAIESYIRGLMAASPEQKHRFFTQAARLDEGFSQPCFQLGKMYAEKEDYRVAAGWLERVSRADSRYLEARFLLGLSRYYLADYEGAAQCFEEVARTVPLNEVLNNLGAAQLRNAPDAAVENFRKALEGDNSDPDYHFNLGYALWKTGNFTAAADSFRAALERDEEDDEATTLLGRCLQESGPRPGETKVDSLERLKAEYAEAAYRQLKAALGMPK